MVYKDRYRQAGERGTNASTVRGYAKRYRAVAALTTATRGGTMTSNAKTRRDRAALQKSMRRYEASSGTYQAGPRVVGRCPGVAKQQRATHRATLQRARAEKRQQERVAA